MPRSRKILSSYSRTQLKMDDLPNELFFQVFVYLLPEDLFKAFGNLNSRFCALIRSAFMHFRITMDNIRLLSVIEANQIKSMMIYDLFSFHTVMNYFQENHLTQFRRLDFRFTSLHSLRAFLKVVPQLDNLKFLRIDEQRTLGCDESKVFYQTIAALQFTPPFLKQLKGIELLISSMTPYYGGMSKPNPLSMLEYFSIFNICLDDLAIVLTWMPQIKCIKITYAFLVNDDDHQLHEHDLTTRSLIQIPTITSLRRLDIGICDGVTCKVC
jgi:hypothetical protein